MAEIQIQGQTISQRPEKVQLDGTEALLLQDTEGTKHAKTSTLKTFVQPDLSGYATKQELSGKVSGTGVTSIQVVTELNGRQVYPSKKRIMDSLVCWYDIGKQQCTNESMAANPVLADLSGNGHDITCYNFAWSGMSGIGGYNWNYNTFSKNIYFEHTDSTITLQYSDGTVFENTINVKNTTFEYDVIKGQKFNVSGIIDGLEFEGFISVVNSQQTATLKSIVTRVTQNGEYSISDLDISELENIGYIYYGFRYITIPEGVTVKIENIPLYPNALVSDGVDDHCCTDGLPILTDYTVIAKRKWLQTENDNNDCFAAKGNILASFLVERYGNNGSQEAYSFGQYNGVSFVQEDIIYQTKESYNGYPLKVGTATDVDNLVILGRTSAPLGCIQAALYSFLLFDRTLTTAEIEWVKKNMIESGGVLATNWADSSLWKNYLDGSRGIGVIKSTEIVINANTVGVSALFETIGERTIDSIINIIMEIANNYLQQ